MNKYNILFIEPDTHKAFNEVACIKKYRSAQSALTACYIYTVAVPLK